MASRSPESIINGRAKQVSSWSVLRLCSFTNDIRDHYSQQLVRPFRRRLASPAFELPRQLVQRPRPVDQYDNDDPRRQRDRGGRTAILLGVRSSFSMGDGAHRRNQGRQRGVAIAPQLFPKKYILIKKTSPDFFIFYSKSCLGGLQRPLRGHESPKRSGPKTNSWLHLWRHGLLHPPGGIAIRRVCWLVGWFVHSFVNS